MQPQVNEIVSSPGSEGSVAFADENIQSPGGDMGSVGIRHHHIKAKQAEAS